MYSGDLNLLVYSNYRLLPHTHSRLTTWSRRTSPSSATRKTTPSGRASTDWTYRPARAPTASPPPRGPPSAGTRSNSSIRKTSLNRTRKASIFRLTTKHRNGQSLLCGRNEARRRRKDLPTLVLNEVQKTRGTSDCNLRERTSSWSTGVQGWSKRWDLMTFLRSAEKRHLESDPNVPTTRSPPRYSSASWILTRWVANYFILPYFKILHNSFSALLLHLIETKSACSIYSDAVYLRFSNDVRRHAIA